MIRFFCAVLAASTLFAAGELHIPIKEFKLDNGLRIVLSEDHSAPSYSIAITYDVGSRDERDGRTGFAHLFEHMMFQGSDNVGKGEHFMLVYTNGGNMNGSTSQDRTNYYQTLPSNQLDLGLFLEADRMRSLVVNQANLDNQRNAVQEEKRLSHDNEPYGQTFDIDTETAYGSFAYKHSIIGSMEDLNAANVQDVQAFFKRYYAPNNAVLTLVGDFNSDEALAKIKKYFAGIPAQPAPPKPDLTEAPQTTERRKTIEDAFAQVPRLDIVYKIPPGNTPDFYAVDVLTDVLSAGTSSRIYQKLVKEKQLAVQAGGFTYEHRGPSLAMFLIYLRPGSNPAEVEKLVYSEIEKVKNEGIAADELEKIQMQNRMGLVREMQSTSSRAVQLGQFAVYYSDPNLINTELQKSLSVTREDVQRAAKKYLVETNRTVVLTMPKGQGGPQGQGHK